jgi:hypothetical protein
MSEAVMLRAIERLLAVAIGGLCVYLGYRLFLRIPEQREGEGKIEFPGGVSIFVARVGPGVFFALFGASIVALSLYKGIVSSAPGSEGTPVYSGVGPTATALAAQPLEPERLRRRLAVEFVNVLPGMLRRDLAEAERREVTARSAEVKLTLMERVWGPDWGNFEEFRVWAEAGAADPVPERLSAAARYFRAGGSGGR